MIDDSAQNALNRSLKFASRALEQLRGITVDVSSDPMLAGQFRGAQLALSEAHFLLAALAHHAEVAHAHAAGHGNVARERAVVHTMSSVGGVPLPKTQRQQARAAARRAGPPAERE